MSAAPVLPGRTGQHVARPLHTRAFGPLAVVTTKGGVPVVTRCQVTGGEIVRRHQRATDATVLLC